MKKLIAGLLGLGLSVLSVASVKAQNTVNRYDSYAVGSPNFSLNSGGSLYGVIGNDPASSKFYLGVGSLQSSSGTVAFTWGNAAQVTVGTYVPQVSSQFESGSLSAVRIKYNGWLEHHQNQVPTATFTGAGTGSVVVGTDQAGDVSIGGVVASVVVTFAEAPSNIPHCFCSNRTSSIPCIAQATATTVTLKGTGSTAGATGDSIDFVCEGHQ